MHRCLILLAFCLVVSWRPAHAADSLGLAIDPFCGFPRVSMTGEPMESYSLQSLDDSLDGVTPWKPMMEFQFEDGVKSWCDSEGRSVQRRFYRMIRLSAPIPEVRTRNFRLLDHTGRNHELYYSFNDPSVVAYLIVFTGSTCSNLIPVLPALGRLSQTYGADGLKIWGVSSAAGVARSRIATEVANLKIKFPVLHDRSQFVSREFGIENVPEAVLIRNASFRVLYRGAVEELDGAGGLLPYLEAAVDKAMAGEIPNPSRVRPLGRSADIAPLATPHYGREIAPILQTKCVTCHSPGNIAPWAMTNHQSVSVFADSIKDEVLAARMPPWHSDSEVGRFANDTSLTTDEASKLVRWLSDGAPRHDGLDPLENVPADPPHWPMGPPDMILRIPNQSLPAFGDVDYRYIAVQPNLTADKWLKAAVVRPGNRRVVHHALVFLGSEASALGGLTGFFAGYVPGMDPTWFPEGTGKLLPKGTQLTFQMHYISIGTPQTDQTELGLYFHSTPPKQRLQTKSVWDVFFNIPARSAEHAITRSSTPFAKTSWLYELSPHQHLRGKWFKYELELQDGTRRTLLNVPRYVFDWQRLYRFAEP
ncbi:MAG: redoxin domain-containing protein, partial [Verrucomicrobia bacterium]|nr:redoxin domain-containing protein [Verrucomicrobiota bacterium]